MMFSRGHFKTGMQSLRGAKWRNFWTMLGVIIGVASVITVVGIGQGIKEQITGQVRHLGKDLITIRPSQIHTGSSSNNLSLLTGNAISGSLTSDDLTTIQKVPGVGLAVPLTATASTIQAETGAYNDGLIIGTTQDFPNLIRQSIAYGSFFSSDDYGTNVAVIGKTAADKMFNEGLPLGRTFSYHGQDFVVRGIFDEFSNAPLSEDANFNDAIFIPYDVSEQLTNNTAPTYEILAKPVQQTALNQVVDRVNAAVIKAHGGAHDVSVQRQDQTLSGSNTILDLLTRLITGIAAISLLVGGIGIMNVMLVSVTERLHEIGIRKAIGATNRQILSQFMVEATVLSLSGGILGIIVAYVIDGLLRVFTALQPSITWPIVVIATGVSLIVGIIFGSVPALKAARKDPIEALRAQ